MHRILHLTDLHLLAAGRARLHGWPVQQAFDRVLDHALAQYPEAAALVLGGDLVDDRSAAGYARLDARLARLGRPVLAVAGNHDDPARMRRTLRHAQVHAELRVGDWTLLALNSRVAGQAGGRVGDAQLAAFAQRLRALAGPALLFLHHPPLALGSAWIDAIGLEDAAALRRLLAGQPRVRAAVCGHAHQAARRRVDGLACWITPSTMRQFRPGAPAFAEDTRRAPGYRVITLGDDGCATTRVRRVPGAAQTA